MSNSNRGPLTSRHAAVIHVLITPATTQQTEVIRSSQNAHPRKTTRILERPKGVVEPQFTSRRTVNTPIDRKVPEPRPSKAPKACFQCDVTPKAAQLGNSPSRNVEMSVAIESIDSQSASISTWNRSIGGFKCPSPISSYTTSKILSTTVVEATNSPLPSFRSPRSVFNPTRFSYDGLYPEVNQKW